MVANTGYTFTVDAVFRSVRPKGYAVWLLLWQADKVGYLTVSHEPVADVLNEHYRRPLNSYVTERLRNGNFPHCQILRVFPIPRTATHFIRRLLLERVDGCEWLNLRKQYDLDEWGSLKCSQCQLKRPLIQFAEAKCRPYGKNHYCRRCAAFNRWCGRSSVLAGSTGAAGWEVRRAAVDADRAVAHQPQHLWNQLVGKPEWPNPPKAIRAQAQSVATEVSSADS